MVVLVVINEMLGFQRPTQPTAMSDRIKLHLLNLCYLLRSRLHTAAKPLALTQH